MQHHVFGRTESHHLATGVTAFGAQIDEPVAGANHVQVVLDHQQRMARVEQFAQRAHQLGDVVKVQPGGGFIQHEQRALARQRLAAATTGLRCVSQETCNLQPLRFAARQRGHGLAQLHVFQPHIHDRLQGANHIAVGAEKMDCFANRQIQHIGHIDAFPLALNGHFQNLRPVALAVAVGAAQVDVAQELHFDVLEARAAAGGAAPVPAVEAELGGGVATFAGQVGIGKDLAHSIPRPHITDRVGARRLADGRLVDKDDFAQLLGPQQAFMRTRRFSGLAEVSQERRGQHILHQRGLARTAHPGNAHQVLQGDLHLHGLQVVLGDAIQNQARCLRRHHALEAKAHLLASAQVGAGQGVGAAQGFGAAVKDNAAALLARAGAHVDHAVGRQHDRRVVLHHHQGVAGVAQALHGLDDAVHVARVQADAGFIQHK